MFVVVERNHEERFTKEGEKGNGGKMRPKNVGYFLNNYAAQENFLGLAVPTTNSFNKCHLFIILSLFTIQHLDQID